jgi:hypothetical protein
MAPTRYLKGECAHCGGHIEFPAEAAGSIVDCPHCGKQTELLLAQPKDQSTLPTRVIVWTVIAVLVLAGGLGAALYALKRAQRWAERQKKTVAMTQTSSTTPTNDVAPPQSDPNDPITKAEFRISEIKLEKKTGSSLIYAAGTLENLSSRTRYGVKLQFDIFNVEGKKIGTSSDYQATMDGNGTWNFRALVVDAKAATVKVTGVSEQQ